jgi:hypothetical protein
MQKQVAKHPTPGKLRMDQYFWERVQATFVDEVQTID